MPVVGFDILMYCHKGNDSNGENTIICLWISEIQTTSASWPYNLIGGGISNFTKCMFYLLCIYIEFLIYNIPHVGNPIKNNMLWICF